MSQDLIERLRCFGYGTTNPEVCKEAADTIESLRAKVAELKQAYLDEAESMKEAWSRNEGLLSQLAAKDRRIAELEVVCAAQHRAYYADECADQGT